MNNSAKGIIWSSIDRFSGQIIQLVISFIIARELNPSIFGIIAIVNVFIAISQVFIDSGFGNALIQKKDRTETDFNTVFFFNIIISSLLYILLYNAAEYIAQFYNNEILIKVTRYIGLVLIINAFAIVQTTKLTINGDFKTQAKATLLSIIISGITAIYLVYNDWGIWALVVQYIAGCSIRTFLLYYFYPWHPTKLFSFKSLKALFSYGSKILAVGIIHTIFQNLYNILIGKVFSTNILGLYNKAFSLSQYPSNNISQIVTRVAFPIFCKLQNSDMELKKYFLNSVRLTMMVVFPIMMLLYVLAEPMIIVLLTEKWIEVVPLLKILCVAYVLNPTMNLCAYVILAKGRSDYGFYAEIIKKTIFIIILISTLPLGVKAMCFGLIIYSIADFIIISSFLKKVIKIRSIDIIKELIPIFLISALTGLIVYFIIAIISSPLLQLLCGVILGLTIIFILMYLFKIKEMMLLINKII